MMLCHSTIPVYIGGPQRSGTSLLRAILGSHSQLAMFPRDVPIWNAIYQNYNKHKDLRRLVHDILGHPKVLDSGVRLNLEPNKSFRRTVRLFLRLYADSVDKPRYGLKWPGMEFSAHKILEEEAIFVHMIRDPRDIYLSRASVDYSELTLKEWVASARVALSMRGKRYLVVRYEDLVASPDVVVRQLCDDLGLEFEDPMLSMGGQPLWEGANSAFGNIGGWEVEPSVKTITTRAVGRHKKLKAPPFTCREMRKLGY